jgi:hypothetical protein
MRQLEELDLNRGCQEVEATNDATPQPHHWLVEQGTRHYALVNNVAYTMTASPSKERHYVMLCCLKFVMFF